MEKLKMDCDLCGAEMTFTGEVRDGLYVYNHPGPCLDENGNNRFENEE